LNSSLVDREVEVRWRRQSDTPENLLVVSVGRRLNVRENATRKWKEREEL